MRKKSYSETPSDTPFNSSIQFLERLERRNEDCDEAKIDGQLITYYRALEALYLNCHMFFNPEERAKVEGMIEICKKEVKNIRVVTQDFVYEDAEDKFDDLRKEIARLLVAYKLTYYQRDRKTWEEELGEDYE